MPVAGRITSAPSEIKLPRNPSPVFEKHARVVLMGLKWVVGQAEAIPALGWRLVVVPTPTGFNWWVSHRTGFGRIVKSEGTSRSSTAAQRAAERAYKSVRGIKR